MNEPIELSGRLVKMPVAAQAPVDYTLKVGDDLLPLNELLGRQIEISFSGEIRCIHCNRKTSKSFSH